MQCLCLSKKSTRRCLSTASSIISLEQLDKVVESVEKGIVKPDSVTYAQLLQRCGKLRAASQGRRLHALLCSSSQKMMSSLVMHNHVINMYAKSGCLDDALRVFAPVRHLRNLVSWNTVIAAYAQHGDSTSAMSVFQQMHLEGMVPDKVTYTTVLNACSSPAALAHTASIHGCILTRGLQTDVILSTALVAAYCRCGSLKDARHTFDDMQHRNVVTWTALISGYGHHGLLDEALDLFWRMRSDADDNIASPNSVTFITVINLCSDFVLLNEGRAVHACYRDEFQQRQSDSEAQEVLAALVNMYGRCGSVEDAFQVFRSMSSPRLCSWNAIISACARNGRGEHALELLDTMPHQPDVITYSAALSACSDTRLLERGKQVHQRLRECDLENNPQICTSLISMYGKCGSLEEARKIFETMSESRNEVSWNAMLSAYLQHGQGTEVLKLYSCMLQQGVQPNPVTLMSAVNACGSLVHLRRVHDCAVERGVESQLQVCNALVHMYGKLGSVEDALNMFQRCTTPNAVTWNGLITAYARSSPLQGYQLLRRMHSEGVIPDRVTFVSVCGILTSLVQLPQLPVIKVDGLVEEAVSQICSAGYERDPMIGTGLIALLGKCGKVEPAESVFEVMRVIRSDVVPWNSMLTTYLDNGEWTSALRLFRVMQQSGFKPDVTTLICLLGCQRVAQQVSGSVEEWLVGDESVWWHHSVRNSVMNMLVKCGKVGRAAVIFQEMEGSRDVISWNVMISGFAQAGSAEDAVSLFRRMQNHGWQPDRVTYVNLLNACGKPEMLGFGREIHRRIQAEGLQGNTVVATALSNMYSKCESMDESTAVFSCMEQRNIVSWNGMIGSYAQQGYAHLALHVFRCMQLHGVKPDGVTWINVLDACGSLSQLQLGRRVRTWMEEEESSDSMATMDVEVENALVNMLAKCGDVEEARRVFDGMRKRKTMVSWSAMVAGYAQVGNVDTAFNMFHLMQREGERPNHITFISVLGACSHAGLVQRGCTCYSSMLVDHGLWPTQEHLGCMVDLLGRAGWIEEARRLISGNKYTPGGIDNSERIQQWMTLLAACSQVGDVQHGSDAAESVLEIDPDHAAAFVALSNAHIIN